jgi:hypothetical protein
MKHWKVFSLAVVLLLFALSLPKPAPAQASSTAFSPGLYYGYINFEVKTNFAGFETVQDAEHRYFWNGFYIGRGKLQLRINNSGGGTISVLLPTKIALSDMYFVDFSKGKCGIADWTGAESYYFDLERWYPSIGFAFQAPYKPASRGISYTEEEPWNDQGGEVTNCAEASQAMLPVGRVVIKGNLDMLSTIQFQTIYATDDNIGGTCSLPGWNQSYSFQPFTTPNVYSTEYCQWRVFRINSDKPQKGNQ